MLWPHNQIARPLKGHSTRNSKRGKRKGVPEKKDRRTILSNGPAAVLTKPRRALANDRIKWKFLVEQSTMQRPYHRGDDDGRKKNFFF